MREAQIILPGTVLVPQRCPVCDIETFAPAGSLCERCNPDNSPLLPRRTPMQPPHDAEHARCGSCQQFVETAKLLPIGTAGLFVLACCPHCGIVWSVIPGGEEAEEATP